MLGVFHLFTNVEKVSELTKCIGRNILLVVMDEKETTSLHQIDARGSSQCSCYRRKDGDGEVDDFL